MLTKAHLNTLNSRVKENELKKKTAKEGGAVEPCKRQVNWSWGAA